MQQGTSILVVCTGNSCRSQIAEGFLNHYGKDKHLKVESAGVEAHGLNPNAVQVMKEIGIDISHHKSKTLSSFENFNFDYVLTVCDDTQACPLVPGGGKRLHFGFPDPAKFKSDNQEEVLAHFRTVRDMISEYCEGLVQSSK